jgi:hypothetical protein
MPVESSCRVEGEFLRTFPATLTTSKQLFPVPGGELGKGGRDAQGLIGPESSVRPCCPNWKGSLGSTFLRPTSTTPGCSWLVLCLQDFLS